MSESEARKIISDLLNQAGLTYAPECVIRFDHFGKWFGYSLEFSGYGIENSPVMTIDVFDDGVVYTTGGKS